MSSKKCARASLRAQPSWKMLWNSCSSSMKPSTSLTCTSKGGITNGSSAVRQRGNISGLLRKEGSAEAVERAVPMRSIINGVVGLKDQLTQLEHTLAELEQREPREFDLPATPPMTLREMRK